MLLLHVLVKFLLGIKMKMWDDLKSVGGGWSGGEVHFVVVLCPCQVSVGHGNEMMG